MHARYLDPQIHRFISLDPVDVHGHSVSNFNRLSYAENNPFAKYDPSGRQAYSPLDPGLNNKWAQLNQQASGGALVALLCSCNPYSHNASGDDSITPTGSPLDFFAPAAFAKGLAILSALTEGAANTTLFRVVGPAELASIHAGEGYTPSVGGLESKYFYPTAEQAGSFAANPANSEFGPFTLTTTEATPEVMAASDTTYVAGEGDVITIPNDQLLNLSSPTVEDSVPWVDTFTDEQPLDE